MKLPTVAWGGLTLAVKSAGSSEAAGGLLACVSRLLYETNNPRARNSNTAGLSGSCTLRLLAAGPSEYSASSLMVVNDEMSNVLVQAEASYKKQFGTLILTKRRHLNWQPSNGQGATLQIEGRQITGLFSSKGSAKIILRVTAVLTEGQPEQNFNFTFTAASSAVSDREHFKTGLADVIAYYKQVAASTPATASPKASTSAHTLDSTLDAKFDVALRLGLLQKDPELKALHIALVVTGQITEEEFWESREHLLQVEQQQQAQIQGRAATLVDARPEISQEGEVKVTVTPQLIADIFAQHPIVQRAYNENVPPLNQSEFWQRFFSSKLYNKIRASSRQAGDTIKDDAIFDMYLDIEEDEADPDNLDTDHIYRLLDLAATEEDHVEVRASLIPALLRKLNLAQTGNQQDFTMRYGHEKATLPLIRRFNHHSERMLEQALGKISASDQISAGDAYQRNYQNDIVIEDLQGPATTNRIILDMQDEQRYFVASNGAQGGTSAEEMNDSTVDLRNGLNTWDLDLGHFAHDTDAFQNAARDLIESLKQRNNVKAASKANAIPESILRQMVSLQSSSNEFLRHFWISVLPPRDGDISFAAKATPAQKAARAQKMAGYLSKTPERVDQVVREAEKTPPTDPERVRAALQPMIEAVEHALAYYKQRTT